MRNKGTKQQPALSTPSQRKVLWFVAVLLVVLVGFLAWYLSSIASEATDASPSDTAATSAGSAQAASGSAQATSAFERAQVVRVVDGDTLIVNLDGAQERIRLIGLDAPESVSPDASRNTPEGAEASAYTKGALPPGTTVYLQKDVSETDDYGRLLRYVWLEVPTNANDPAEVREKMFNAILIASGHAQAKRYPPDTRYTEVFEAIARG